MKALIDGDILVYECAFGAQDRETGEVYSFELLRERLDKKIADICDGAQADCYQIYLTGKDNFRNDIAVTKPYKGNRKNSEKPFHYDNTRFYLESLGAIVVDGMEADDAMAIAQTDDTVICTRDKDLRQVPGLHYGWEHGKQPEYFLKKVDEIGEITLSEGKSKEVKGTGLKFFYSQLITGDTTDNIPGLRLGGPALAYKLLSDTTSELEMYEKVRQAYVTRKEKDNADYDVDELILEQARLLWMVRELTEEGEPVHWSPPSLVCCEGQGPVEVGCYHDHCTGPVIRRHCEREDKE